MTPTELEQLGFKLARGGPPWWRHLERARELWRSIQHGGKAAWDLEHAGELAAALGLGPKALPKSTRCPTCPNPRAGEWNGSRTKMHLPDRYTAECSKCSTVWVVLLGKERI